MSLSQRVFDPAPLLRQVDLSLNRRPGKFADHHRAVGARSSELPLTDQDRADALGVTRRSIQRWRQTGELCESSADLCACRLGLHPALLWADWYD